MLVAMYSILPYTDNPALREKAKPIPVHRIDSPAIETLIKEMKQLLSREQYGVALAAPQVGESLRLFIVSGKALLKADENENKKQNESALPDMVYINPVVTKISRQRSNKHEGCLSIRGKWGVVPRAEKVTITAYDEHGKKFTRGASGFLAHIFQHEMDHLEGILYIDKATELYDEEHEYEN